MCSIFHPDLFGKKLKPEKGAKAHEEGKNPSTNDASSDLFMAPAYKLYIYIYMVDWPGSRLNDPKHQTYIDVNGQLALPVGIAWS